LNNTRITDQGLENLSNMDELQSLSLVGTEISAKGIARLSKLKNLKHLYLYKTGVQRSEWKKLRTLFPKVDIDFGNYRVPTLPKDTIEVKVVALLK